MAEKQQSEIKSAEYLAIEGHAAYQRGDYLAAVQAFQAAAESYRSLSDNLMAAEMMNNSSVALLKAGDAPGALKAVEGTELYYASAGDLRRQAIALGNRAAALDEMGRLAEASTAYEQSADLLKQIGEDELRSYVMKSLSTLQLRTGRHWEAVATMQAGINGIRNPNLKQKLLKRLLQLPFTLMKTPRL